MVTRIVKRMPKDGIESILFREGFESVGSERSWILGSPHAYERQAFNETPATRIAVTKRVGRGYDVIMYTLPATSGERVIRQAGSLTRVEEYIKEYIKQH